uniref:RING-type domain-containing protein n=1 Tax=Alexandrium catenella TaxID=2925 RepID=A0A7S1LQ93_ALECA
MRNTGRPWAPSLPAGIPGRRFSAMSFVAELGARTRRAVDAKGPEIEELREQWLREADQFFNDFKLECCRRADARCDNACVDLCSWDGADATWASPVQFGVNDKESLGPKYSFIGTELAKRIDPMGFATVRIEMRPVGEANGWKKYVAVVRWAVPDSAAPAKPGPKHGNLVVQCGVCMEKLPSSVLSPCGHLVCQTCAEKHQRCPFCRERVDSAQVVFKP